MLRKSPLYFRKSLTIRSFVLIILVGSVYVEAVKSSRRSGQKGKPNHDAIALSYGNSRKTGTVQQHQTSQVYPQAASAPPRPNNYNNNPIGWNIPAPNTPVQQKTVSNTNIGFQAPAHSPGYPTQNHAPPPYNTHLQYPQNPSHNSGPPPAYSAPIGAPNTGYPQQGVHTVQQGSYIPQQQSIGGYNPQQGSYYSQPAHPNPSYQQPIGSNGQQAPVVNNYYPSQMGTRGSGSSIGKNALLLGAGGLAGAAIYGALKPGEESKTVIIHDTVPSQPPNVSPAAVLPTPAVQMSETNIPLASVPSNVPLVQATNFPIDQSSTDVPSVPMFETTGISTVTNMPESGTTISNQPMVPLAPMPGSNMNLSTSTEQRSNNNYTTVNAETPISTSVPAEMNPSLQAHLKGHATHLKSFNIFVYAAIATILAKLLI